MQPAPHFNSRIFYCPNVLWNTKVFNVYKVQLIYIFLLLLVLLVSYPRSYCLKQCHEDLLQCFPLSFMVLALTFMSMIHLELSWLHGVSRKKSSFILLHVDTHNLGVLGTKTVTLVGWCSNQLSYLARAEHFFFSRLFWLYPLHFHMTFKISLSIFAKKASWGSDGSDRHCIEAVDWFGDHCRFTPQNAMCSF